MIRTALTMLVGDRAKFLGIVFGLAFASLLITQQAAIFRGVMVLVYGHVTDTPQVDVWVSDPGMPDFDTNDMINERELDLVRGVEGVRWAVPLNRRVLYTRKPDNEIAPIMVMGIDDGSLIGGPLPQAMVRGSLDDLRRPNTVIIDEYSATTKLAMAGPDGVLKPMRVGDYLRANGTDIEVVGICRSTMALMLFPTAYMLRSQCSQLDASTDQSFNFILVGLAGGADPAATCARIDAATGLSARTTADFCSHVYDFFLYQTGIPANFGIAVLLGFVVGAAIAGQTFSQFVSDNRRTFASLKAMGMRNGRLAWILLVQAVASALVGYGLGVGAATLFGVALEGTDLSFRLEPELMVFSFVSVLVISIGAALVSLRSVVSLDPALVFRS